MGAVVVYSILRPESLLVYRLLVFALSFCFYTVVAFVAGMFLFTKSVRSLDEAEPPWTRTQNVLLGVVVVVALAIGVSMGVWMAGDVRQDDNPWPDDVEQTYPY
jgi:ABC-type proline/glycine betaine transport system permease subunit